MSLIEPVLRNSAVLFAGTAASKILVLVSYAILTRSLGPEGFGQYSLVFAWLAFAEVFTDSGLDWLVGRQCAADPPSTGRRVGEALVLRTLLAAVALPVAVLAFGPVTGAGGAALVAIGGITLLTSSRRTSWRSLLEIPFRIVLDMRLPMILMVLSEALHVFLIAGPLRPAGLGGAVAAQALAPIPFLVGLAILAGRRSPIRLGVPPARLAGLAGAAVPFLGVLLLNVVLSRIDLLMLERIRDSREVGLYAAPTRIAETVNLLPALLMTSVYPLFAARHRAANGEGVARLFRESLRVLAAILVPLVAVQIAFARPLVHVLFGGEWTASAEVLPWLAAAGILVCADIVITARLLATGRERLNLVLVAVAAVTNVGLNLALIPELGARGAAIATLAAYAARVLAGFLPAVGRAMTRQVLASLLPPIVAGAVAFAPSFAGGTWRATVFAVGVVAYPALLWLLGGARSSDLRDLLDVLGRRSAGRAAGADRTGPNPGDGGPPVP